MLSNFAGTAGIQLKLESWWICLADDHGTWNLTHPEDMSSEKDIANTVYNAAVVSGLSLAFNMAAKKLIKMKPADLGKPDAEDAIKLLVSVSLAMFTRDYLVKAGYLKPNIIT